jgi:acetoin:2,6-dichlorophenolindophenol oxidoreductase subunit alpha
MFELERPGDSLAVESEQRAPECLRAESPASRDEEAKLVAAAKRVRASEQRGRAIALGGRNRERDADLRPVGREFPLQLDPLPDKPHDGGGYATKLVAMARVAKREELSQEQLTEFLHDMLLIRRFEEKVEERFRAGELPGFLHVAIGQEAVCVGVCRAMEDGDVFASTHRAHGHTLARGTTPNAVMAELYGKVEGCSHGYGGSMHLYDVERGNLGANAVVGGGLPAITGAALAFQFRGEPRVALAFFGDGATNIGTFHESLNLAQLWRVPAVFVCENNHWAESTPGSQHLPIEDLTQRADAFGMHSITVDGQDVEAVWAAAREALEHARSGAGPVFLLANTHRLTGHYVGDPQVYRDKDEFRETRANQDPLTKLRSKLEFSDDEWERLDTEITKVVEESVEFAKAGTDPKPEDALKNVYA